MLRTWGFYTTKLEHYAMPPLCSMILCFAVENVIRSHTLGQFSLEADVPLTAWAFDAPDFVSGMVASESAVHQV